MKIAPSKLSGVIRAIPSKSHAHRLLILAALAEGTTMVHCPHPSEDILRTADCLNALCAKVVQTEEGFHVTPRATTRHALLNCGESGSTYRFMLPLACALHADTRFHLSGRLPCRPMDGLTSALAAHGIAFSGLQTDTVTATGHLLGGAFSLPGDVSSQFISGLLLAAPRMAEGCTLSLTSPLSSRGYVDITLDALHTFGITAEETEAGYHVPAGQACQSPGVVQAEGDWSNAAFWLCAAAAGQQPLTVQGLNPHSPQGDKTIVSLLRRFGANVQVEGDKVHILPAPLHPANLDVDRTPDLAPPLALVAAAAQGISTLQGISRLRIKESDRANTIVQTLSALGMKATEHAHHLTIHGTGRLSGGQCDAFNDHRIAMLAACSSVLAEGPIDLSGADAVHKSYPHFFADAASLGMRIQ